MHVSRAALSGLIALSCLGACTARRAVHEVDVDVATEALIGGEPAPELSGVVHVSHVHGDRLCSGALIAPELVVTALHCVMHTTADGDALLGADGFRIGFGPLADTALIRGVQTVMWVGASSAVAIAEAIEAGEDVAVLRLDSPAPPGETSRAMALDFVPEDQEAVHMSGFGLTDARTGVAGRRSVGSGRITGFDRERGVVQVSGDSACFGDSGGPVLSDDLERVLGVLGQVGGGDQHDFCNVGLSFAATAANPSVQRLVAKQCAAVGGCGRRPTADAALGDGDGGFAEDGAAAVPNVAIDAGKDDASHDSPPMRGPTEVGEDPGHRPSRANASACAVREPHSPGHVPSEVWGIGVLAALRFRARTRTRPHAGSV